MAVVIELTQEQWEALTVERAKLGAMEDANAPGMMIAQVFGDHMKVGVIDNEKARAVQRAFGVENDGKTCRTAYDVPANVMYTSNLTCNLALCDVYQVWTGHNLLIFKNLYFVMRHPA